MFQIVIKERLQIAALRNVFTTDADASNGKCRRVLPVLETAIVTNLTGSLEDSVHEPTEVTAKHGLAENSKGFRRKRSAFAVQATA